MSEVVKNYFIQRPDERLDYDFDFTLFLGADTISSHAVTADVGITVDVITPAYPLIKVWLKDGTTGKDYNVKARVVTATGRAKDLDCWIQIRK